MYEKYHDLGLEIITISLDEKKQNIVRFLKDKNISFIVLKDSKLQIASKYHVKVMPSSFLIDRDGNFYSRHRGFTDTDMPKIEEKFRDLLLN